MLIAKLQKKWLLKKGHQHNQVLTVRIETVK